MCRSICLLRIYMCSFVCAFVYWCIDMFVHWCITLYLDVLINEYICVLINVFIDFLMYWFICVCVYVFMRVCVYVLMYLCIDAFMYMCIYVKPWMCIYVIFVLCNCCFVQIHLHYCQSHLSLMVISTCSTSLVLSVRMGRMQYLVFMPALVTVPWGIKV